jgi:hypothetical protein
MYPVFPSPDNRLTITLAAILELEKLELTNLVLHLWLQTSYNLYKKLHIYNSTLKKR